MRKIDPPFTQDSRDTQIYDRIGRAGLVVNGFKVAALPPADKWAGDDFSALIYITDEAGGSVIAFSDGLNWRRMTDRAIIS